MTNSYGTAGKATREMAQNRYVKVWICSSLLFLIAILIFSNIFNIAKICLPAIIILAIILKVADLIEKKGLFYKKRAKDAERGAYAEEVVAEGLKNLPEGYQVFHDIAFTGFNIDHVVIGPGGIFLVETKSHKGKVDAKGDTLLLNGKEPPKNFLNQTWSQTYQLKEFLQTQTAKELSIRPILCFTRAYVRLRQPVKGILVLNYRYLATCLLKQPHIINSEDIENLSRILQSSIR
jgi:hypothetical protein